MVSYLWLAGVSRSGYYAWLKAAENEKDRLKQEEKDVRLIKIVYRCRRKVGKPSNLNGLRKF